MFDAHVLWQTLRMNRPPRTLLALSLVALSACPADDDALPPPILPQDASADVAFDVASDGPGSDVGLEDASVEDAPLEDAPLEDGATDGDPGGPQVLFIGNSYTAWNELPAVAAQVSEDAFSSLSALLPGARLMQHWEMPETRALLESGTIDAVIVQAQSMEPAVDTAGFLVYAQQISDLAEANDVRTIWFSTWGRRDIEPEPETFTRQLEAGYRMAAESNGDEIARVGEAWLIADQRYPEIQLFDADLSHPSPAGTLLAACVIAKTITGENPIVPIGTPHGIGQDDAVSLCAIANDGVPCNVRESLCEGSCTPWDSANCGGCSVACADAASCVDGACVE